MSRQASPFTNAVRELCEKSNFTLKYNAARPLLAEMGVEIAPEPSEKTEAYSQWEKAVAEAGIKRPKAEDELHAWYKETVKAAGLPSTMVDAIMTEDAPHHAFNCERNNFNVTKFNYERKVGNSVSEKPKAVKKTPAKRAPVAPVKVSAKKTQTRVVSGIDSLASDVEAVQWLLANGGFSAVEQKIAEMTQNLKKAKVAWNKLSSKAA